MSVGGVAARPALALVVVLVRGVVARPAPALMRVTTVVLMMVVMITILIGTRLCRSDRSLVMGLGVQVGDL